MKIIIPIAAVLMLVASPLLAQQEGEESERPRSSFYDPTHIEGRTPAQLPEVREADILWSKKVWQQIDVRETINQQLYFPREPTGRYRSLMSVIEEAVREGELEVYHRNDEYFEDDPLDPDEAFERFERERTVEDDDEVFILTEEFNAHEVWRYRIREEWFIDSNRGILDVRIIGILPIRRSIDELTDEEQFEALFWIPYEEARKTFATAPVYNRHSDLPNMSFDDFFIRRFFNATIYREQRPDNAEIIEYIDDPVERLMEAERIKEEIRNKELDLWHY